MAVTPQDYSFGKRSAAAVYEALCPGQREGVLEEARDLSRITIPSLFPPEGWRPGDPLPPPNQSTNARAIVNLASRIMLTGLPPSGMPCLKFQIVEHKMQPAIDRDPQLYAETKLALTRRAIAHTDRLEATTTRTAYTEHAQQLLVGGNSLWKSININHPTVHKMDTYVVMRDTEGEPLYTVLKQPMSLDGLAPSVEGFIRNVRATKSANSTSNIDTTHSEDGDVVTIYCCCKLKVLGPKDEQKKWLYWEEFEGETIPGSESMSDYHAPPMYPSWMIPQYGFNWGLSYCHLYAGDLYKVENGEASLNDGMDLASLSWLFVNPAGMTSKKVLEQARNGKLMHGRAEDVTVFRLDKTNDFGFVQNNVDNTSRRLMQAFLMNSAIQRPGDRVTAEEWRTMARELSEAMGGLYSSLAQGSGKAIVSRFVALHEYEDKSIRPLPKDVIRMAVITGMDALGLDMDEQNLEMAFAVLSKFMPPDQLMAKFNGDNLITRVLAGYSVKPDGLLKTADEQAADAAQAQQQQAGQTILEQGAGPLAKEGAAALMPQLMNAMQPNSAPQEG
jgi:hypothetical protein